MGNKLDNESLETYTFAEQLSTNLTDLNERIEGKTHVYPNILICPIARWNIIGFWEICLLNSKEWFVKYIELDMLNYLKSQA